MKFTLWSPRGKNAIVRIYIENTPAYIERTVKSSLKVKDCEPYFYYRIIDFLAAHGIIFEEMRTRRELASALYDAGLLTGDYHQFMDTFHNPDKISIKPRARRSNPTMSTVSESAPSHGNVVSMFDFKRRRDT